MERFLRYKRPASRFEEALPELWADGAVSGLIAKGNITVNLIWREGKVKKLSLKSPLAQAVRVLVNGEMFEVTLDGENVVDII